ncbi:MAG TPA: RNA methyltransferase, partial [Acidimicrobiales bacterium]|nr:RNA methyltransferase [Acidimicrobiales bacterium]
MAEGPKLLEEALRAGAPVEVVYLEGRAAGDRHREVAEAAARAGASVLEVEAGVLARACEAVTPQPVAAIVSMRHVALESLPLDGLTVVGVGVQDPGNAGTVIRSASASGSCGVVFCAGAVDIYNPKAVRASAGTVFHLPLAVGGEAGDVLDHLGARGVARLGTVVRGGRDHDGVDWTRPAALVLGSESHGLPGSLDSRIDGQVTIPMHQAAESLNVAMAATVICFEAARQRRAAGRG